MKLIAKIKEFIGEWTEEDVRLYIEEQLTGQFVKLQKRYMKHNGFGWNPAMYEGNRMREVSQ